MMHLVRRIWGPGKVSEEQVQAVMMKCSQCASIDPTSLKWEAGEHAVRRTWQRRVIDVTHLFGEKFLSIVDCGPGRYSM